MTAVAVVGASGLVGATLVERLLATRHHDVRPWIHTSGNAWRLARHGLELRSVDLLHERDVRSGVEGCEYVVNCSRGSDAVMLEGLRNLLHACRAAGVQRFVHLSSVAVYGDPPPPDSVHEDARPRALRGTYGGMKLRQDDLVRAACRRGLPAVILCPPNISGPYSPFLLSIIDAMRTGRLAMVEGGETPCNLVDVENLASAIELALSCDEAVGTRIFVTDGVDTTWRDVAEALAPVAGRPGPLPTMSRAEARRLVASGRPRPLSVVGSVKHMISADVRSVLRQNPLIAKIDGTVRSIVGTLLSEASQHRVRQWVSGPGRVTRPVRDPGYDERFIGQQLREVRHDCTRAKRALKYVPERDFVTSMQSFRSWYELHHGTGSEDSTLLSEL